MNQPLPSFARVALSPHRRPGPRPVAAVESDDNDSFSHRGAERIAATIEAFWKRKGVAVEVTVQRGVYATQTRSVYFVVRSNLINGGPA